MQEPASNVISRAYLLARLSTVHGSSAEAAEACTRRLCEVVPHSVEEKRYAGDGSRDREEEGVLGGTTCIGALQEDAPWKEWYTPSR